MSKERSFGVQKGQVWDVWGLRSRIGVQEEQSWGVWGLGVDLGSKESDLGCLFMGLGCTLGVYGGRRSWGPRGAGLGSKGSRVGVFGVWGQIWGEWSQIWGVCLWVWVAKSRCFIGSRGRKSEGLRGADGGS